MISPIRTAALALCLAAPALADDPTVDSPGAVVQFRLGSASGRLRYSVSFRGKTVIETSRLGITVDSVDLGDGVLVGGIARYTIDESYPWNGVHSPAVDRCHGARVEVQHVKSKTAYSVDVRAYDDGIAFRTIVPGEGTRVPDEATMFQLPARTRVWFHDLEDFYEGVHKRRGIGAVQPGAWAAPPVTFQTDGVWGAITEGGLAGFSGMALQGDGENGFRARLAHSHPMTWIYRHDFPEKADQVRVGNPATSNGTIRTPWRIVLLGDDLNTLVNADIVHNVADKPDPKLFPKGAATDWIKPGRAVWCWSDGGRRTLEGMKEFSRLAGQLGFEYNVLEGFWYRWPEAQIRELVDYSRERGVGIILWRHRRELLTRDRIQAFADLMRRTGVAGAKLDAYDHEHKEVVDQQQEMLKAAAERQLVIDLHGTGKSAGQDRTWPNQLGHEGIRGMEASPPWAQHDTTLPFTRMLAGLGDFTPTHFGEDRGDTTWAHQVANAVILSAPLLVYAAHPANILANPTAEMLKSIPSVWDETVVLPLSEIGEVAVFARRREDTWFLAVTNGPNPRTLAIPLSFLAGRASADQRRSSGSFTSLLVRDGEASDAVKLEHLTMTPGDTLYVQMPAGGGFVGRFTR